MASMTSSADLDALLEEGAGMLDPSAQQSNGGGGGRVADALGATTASMASSADLDALMAEGAASPRTLIRRATSASLCRVGCRLCYLLFYGSQALELRL